MLWLEGNRTEAFLQLYCRFELQSRRILRKFFRVNLKTPAAPIRSLLSDYRLKLDPVIALSVVLNKSTSALLGFPVQSYRKIRQHRNALVHGYGSVSQAELTTSFEQLIQAMERLASHGSALVDATGCRKLTTSGMPRRGDAQTLIKWLFAHHQRLELTPKAIRNFSQLHCRLSVEG